MGRDGAWMEQFEVRNNCCVLWLAKLCVVVVLLLTASVSVTLVGYVILNGYMGAGVAYVLERR